MLKNYILVAIRQFTRHKVFSALNIFCLAIGISFCLLVGEYVLRQYAVNQDLRNIGNQYLLKSDWKIKNTGPEITTVGPVVKALKKDYPDLVANYFRFNPVTNVVSAGDRHFKEDVAISDTTLISMYGYPLLYGDPRHAFANSSSAVISEELALKLYGDRNAIGKLVTLTLTTGGTQDFTVSAVFKTLPYNSVNNLVTGKSGYSMYVPFEGNRYYSKGAGEENWTDIFTVSCVELQPGVKPAQLDGPIRKLLSLNSPETISKNLRVNLLPLKTYYLDTDNNAVSKALTILSLVALGILLLAVINFINILVGTSSYRIREIGLRKVFGSRRAQLVSQYLTESVVLTFFAGILSLILYGLFRPLFSSMLDTSLPSLGEFSTREIIFLCMLTGTVGILAGIYPALILSGSEVISSVKGKLSSVERGVWLKKSLLTAQFTIATGVFIFSLTLSKQIHFLFASDLGYDKEQLMVITAFPKQWDSVGVVKMESIRNGLLNLSSVRSATVSFEVPDRMPPSQFQVTPQGSKESRPISIQSIAVDENYAETYGLRVLEGRFFRKGEGGFVSGETVITESAKKQFGWTTAAGKKIEFANGGGTMEVVGVVNDYHTSSFHESMLPVNFVQVKDARAYRYLTVKLKSGDVSASIAAVRDKWKELSPAAPFEYFFMDEKLQSMYKTELQLKKAAATATTLMLIIVLLGIFGVLSLALTRRTREIAVRKVLGAGAGHILSLFIKQYAGLLLISNLIAWPVTYYFCGRWLQQYVYRIAQPVSVYIMAGAGVVVIAFALIILQCLKVASANPVQSLKTE
jgi:ABC-type antimicrobial peptide transport system permease subunit